MDFRRFAFQFCHAVRREVHESCSCSDEAQYSRFKSICIRALFSRFFDVAVDIFACAHFRTLNLAAATTHSCDFCRTCVSEAMCQQLHDHSHSVFAVILHQFSKCSYFSIQNHSFRFVARCVALLFEIAIATCVLARVRSKALQEVLI